MENSSPFASPGGLQGYLPGSPLASATSITPTHPIHEVTGDVAIETIDVPYEGFAGPLILLAQTGGWSWNTNGNIAVGSDGETITGLAYMFFYNKARAKWYPTSAIDNFNPV